MRPEWFNDWSGKRWARDDGVMGVTGKWVRVREWLAAYARVRLVGRGTGYAGVR